MRLSSFLYDLSSIGLAVPKPTFQQWGRNIQRRGSAELELKASGRPKALDQEQLLVLSGFIFQANDAGREVHLPDFVSAALDVFDVKVSTSTASCCLRAMGFSFKVVQRKPGALHQDRQSLAKLMWQWVADHQIPSLLSRRRSQLCSVDFTYSGHRTDRRTSFARSGEAQPSATKMTPRYTNCLLTCVWDDGSNRTPCMLFTYNPVFRLDRSPTPARLAQSRHFMAAYQRHKVAHTRIQYIGKKKGEARKYVAEASELVKVFFQAYQFDQDVVVLSDNGNAFFDCKKSVVPCQHICYPAAVHQWLSPNENRLHGAAKARWRSPTLDIDFNDDVDSSLQLMRFLDLETKANSKKWFENNMICATPDSIEDMITGSRLDNTKFRKSAIRAWQRSQGVDPRGDLNHIPFELQDSLDGDFYYPILNE